MRTTALVALVVVVALCSVAGSTGASCQPYGASSASMQRIDGHIILGPTTTTEGCYRR